METAFEAATRDRPLEQVHVEYFKAMEKPAAEGGFDVRLAKSNRTIRVEAGKTILNALLDAGVTANYACTEGICGTCETRVIEGKMVEGNMDAMLARWEVTSIDAKRTLVAFQLLMDPKLPLPDSFVSSENAWDR